jgi:hypothetical protein
MNVATDALRFDDALHQYIDTATGEVLKGVTQLLVLAGEVSDEFYSEDSRERGTQVHRLTLDYDLGALDVSDCVTKYRGWLLAWASLSSMLQGPTWLHLEETFAHPLLRFAGTPDRVGHVYRRTAIGEIKSGPRPSPKKRGQPGPHELQTALQAILVARHLHVRPELITRWGFYIREDGSFKAIEFIDPADLRRAREIIRKFCM